MLSFLARGNMIKKPISSGVLIPLAFFAIFLFSSFVFSQEDYSQWQYSTTIDINTVGAGLSSRVDDYPLLVRLTNSNFPFGLAAGDGSDIRFSETGGAHLYYEKVRYDSASGVAEFWVLLSSVHADNDQQPFKMYWGKPGATDSSNSEAVFSTSNSFAAVYHLPSTGSIRDATSNNNDPLSYRVSQATGIIGDCKGFNGTDSYINCGSKSSLDGIGALTIEAWIYVDSWGGNSFGRIVDKANDNLDGLSFFVQNNSTYGYESLAFMRDPAASNPDSAYARSPSNSLSLLSWYHVAMSFSGGISRLYINGSQPSYYPYRSTMPGGSSMFSDASFNLTIGNNSGRATSQRPFDGRIDEVRIQNTVRSSNWIKLDYLTQRSNQGIVTVNTVNNATITSQPVSDSALTGGSASFSVGAMGNPSPSYQWQKLSGSTWSDISGATSNQYSIDPVSKSDTGSFRVRVWNSGGADTSVAVKLYVFDPPVIGTHPTNQNVAVGATGTFSVTATGDLLGYQWQERPPGGSWGDISGATSSSYTTPTATAQMNGTQYRCVVSGALGSSVTSNSASLQVSQTVKPEIITDLYPTYQIVAGNDSTLSISAVGQSPLSYQWEKYGASTWDLLSGETSADYRITGMNASYAGLYRVRVWNDSGADTSVNANVGLSGPVQIILHPVNDTVLVGQQYQFKIRASGGTETIKYQWQRRDGSDFNDITGKTDSTLTGTADSSSNGTWFRCRIWSGPYADTSSVGVLVLGLAPIIGTSPRDSVIPVGASLELKGSGSGVPTPTMTWYFKAPSASPVELSSSVALNTTYKIDDAVKADSGYYYFVAKNRFDTVTSDTALVHVLEPLKIIIDLPTTYSTIHGGAAAFQPTVSGDGLINYQWYQDDILISGATSRKYSIASVDSATHQGKKYHCNIFNQFIGTLNGVSKTITISMKDTRGCTIEVGKYYNPFSLVVERVDSLNVTEARVKLSSLVDISNFPYTTDPFKKYADSLWIFYKSFSFPVQPINVNMVSVPIESIVKAYPNTFEDIVYVGNLPDPNDSLFYFSYSVKWHNKDTLLPLQEANSVLYVDTNAIKNVLNVYGDYYQKSDSVKIVIDSINQFTSADSARIQTVIVDWSNFPDFSIPLGGLYVPDVELFDSTVQWSRDERGILGGNYEKHIVYVRWYIRGKDGSTSKRKYSQFEVGWDRPIWAGPFDASEGSRSNRLNISWQDQGADSMKFWHNTDTIPYTFDHDQLLQATGNAPKVLVAPTITADSILGLTSNTMYYVGAQVFKDMMWSRISPISVDSAKTKKFDIDQKVINRINIDSTKFDPVTNEVVINWHINRTQYPPPANSKYKTGYSYTFKSYIDSTEIVHGNEAINQDINITRISISNLIWDSTYTVGLWLWFQDTVSSGESRRTEPTDTSQAPVKVPSFTWQVVRLFPEPSLNETVAAANGKIVFHEKNQFPLGGEIDTIRAFNTSALTLPAGLTAIDALSFRFCRYSNKPFYTPPFTLELPYKSLPGGISEDNLGIYRYINGKFHAVHGFKEQNKVVTVEITRDDLNLNGSYPFMVLADTRPPSIQAVNDSETVDIGKDIISEFSVIDNIANARCYFLYGRGNEGYGKPDTIPLTSDTSTFKKAIPNSSSAVSQYYGTRILLVADDGIQRDTINVSRCVQTTNADNFSIPEMEWAPLRVAATLDDPSLHTNFNRSSSDEWIYDTKKIRLFRFYTADSATANDWIEYQESNKQHFEFNAGRLIWCKAKESQTLNFGGGYTTSLRKPFSIHVKANTWTDFCLPFQFKIKLKDVKKATGDLFDSLDFYHWEKNNTTYTTEPMRISLIDMRKPLLDTLIFHQKNDGYTVFNRNSTDIILQIPPISLPLSPDLEEKRGQKEEQETSWDIRFLWKEKNLHHRFQKVICAYNGNLGDEVIFGSLPPGMGSIRTGIMDSVNNSIHGYAINTNVEKGGTHFKIAFRNGSEVDANIEYRLQNLDMLPEGYMAKVLNPESRKYEACDDSVVSELKVSAGSGNMASRLVVIGTGEYLNDVLHWISPATFAFLKAYPNPFTGTIRLHYTLPPDISEVQITLYNVLGRRLWRAVQRKGISAGEHTFTFNSRKDLGTKGVLPTGVYILRLSAKNKAGKLIYGGDKRITCIK